MHVLHRTNGTDIINSYQSSKRSPCIAHKPLVYYITTIAVLLASIATVTPAWGPVASAAPQPAAPRDKILVDAADDNTLAELQRQGAVRMADYGAFSLWQVPTDDLTRLREEPGVSVPENIDTIYLRGGRSVDTAADSISIASGLRQTRIQGSQFWLVQFIGPVKDEWLDELHAMNLKPVMYMPNNAYVIWGNGAAIDALEKSVPKSPSIQWTGPFHPDYRLAPALQESGPDAPPSRWADVTVQIYDSPDVGTTLERLVAMSGAVYQSPSTVLNFVDVSLQLPTDQLAEIAGWRDVFNVEPYVPPHLSDEVQSQIVAGNVTTSGGNIVPSGPGYLSWLASKGFPTTPSSYPVVDVVDDGVDIGNATNVLHPDFHEFGSLSNPDRIPYMNNCTQDASGNGVGGHGNINAGIVASYNNRTGWPYVDTLGYRIGLGISPYGRVASTKVFRNSGGWDDSKCGGTDPGVVAASYSSGATMTSNSWGAAVYGAYNASSQAYDALTRDASSGTPGNQQMLHIFAAGNQGSTSNSIDAPGTAKNVLTVGATENVRDNGVADGCGDSAANNADDVASFSSRGPTDDGRIKPDIMAPGTHVQGPASQDPAFDGSGVCGATGNTGQYPPTHAYYPEGQTLYTWSSGTSHSTPAVAGAASLLYEYFGRVLRAGHTPSPALTKALLMNSARYLAGLSAGDTLPSPNQGWGDVNLGRLFDGTPSESLDQGIVLDETGQTYEWYGAISSGSQPFRVTLAWTDAPGNTTGAAYVNDLDLEVTIGANVYKGNVFSGQSSVMGGSFDTKNNVESVFLPSGTTGSFRVRVIARNIAGDGVPGNGDVSDQDFALAVYNAGPAPLLEPADVAWHVIAGQHNGVVDPGDTIGLYIDLYNTGTATAIAPTASLSLTQGLATVPTNTTVYPDIGIDQTQSNLTQYVIDVDESAACGSVLSFQHLVTVTGSTHLAHPADVPIGLWAAQTRSFAYSGPPVPIPDNDPTGVTATIEITRTGWVQNVDVHFDATHSWDGDLGVDLISPQGTTVSLYFRSGGSGHNFVGTIFDDSAATPITQGTAPFTGRFRPREALSKIADEPVSGTWTLKVADYAQYDIGQINGFALDITGEAAYCNMIPQYFPIIVKNAYE